MAISLQQILEQADGMVTLPPGEYEGPFTIRKPLIVSGSATTIWAKYGPALQIESIGVTIKNLRIEVTEAEKGEKGFLCLSAKTADTVFEQVEIIGEVSGVTGEDGEWELPQVISLGNFPAGQTCHFQITVNVPSRMKAVTVMQGVHIIPEEIPAGKSTITIVVDAMRAGTFLYGSILFASTFLRRLYLTGIPNQNLRNYTDYKLLFMAKDTIRQKKQSIVQPIKEQTAAGREAVSIHQSLPAIENMIELKRGQRTELKDFNFSKITVRLGYKERLQEMEIDPYIFLLDQKNRAEEDRRLIFFSNPKSWDQAVSLEEEGKATQIHLDLTRVSEETGRIAICYSIYGENPNYNFSKVSSPVIRIFSEEKEKMRFYPTELFLERTIVLVEFYRYQGTWKINTVGAGFQGGLKRLCESYGLTIIE